MPKHKSRLALHAIVMARSLVHDERLWLKKFN